MNSKQKVGYMALGAAILAVGIVIGQLVTPDITAQNNGVFDEIRCSKLTVVDETGNTALLLVDDKEMRGVVIYDKTGNLAAFIGSSPIANYVLISDKTGNPAASLGSNANGNSVNLQGKAGKEKISMLAHEEYGNVISIRDRAGNVTWQAP